MARLLLLLSARTYRAEAFLAAAARLGVRVTVGTDRAQVLAELAPESNLTLDFQEIEASTARIRSFAGSEPIDAVLAAEDDGAVLAAAAAEALGLRHATPAAVRIARDKLATRVRLAEAGLPAPPFRVHDRGDDPRAHAAEATYPCVLKPLFLSASRGVIRADDPAGFAAAWRRIGAILDEEETARAGGALARRILVEAYVPGDEFAVEGLWSEGRFRALAVFEKPDPLEGPYFEETIYLTPPRIEPDRRRRIEASARAGAEAIGLVEGPLHAEVRSNPEGEWLLEIAPRSIGGLCSRALRFTGGATLEELLLRHALGEPVGDVERESSASGVLMIPIPAGGVLREVEGVAEAKRVPHVEEIRITTARGTRLVPLPEGHRYLGFLFARAPEPDAVEAALRAAHGRLRFVLDSGPERERAPGPRDPTHASRDGTKARPPRRSPG